MNHKHFFPAILFFGVLISFLMLTCSKDNEINDGEPLPSNQRIDDTLYSQKVNDTYPMKIYIPAEFENNKNLPIVYLLDGLVADPINNVLFFDEVIQSMQTIGLKAILVAVGDKRGFNRTRDFLAEGCVNGTAVGFSNFLSFIREELIPYIDEKYENNHSKRTLIGHSFGGSFAYNAFFREDPNEITFRGYIAVDATDCNHGYLEGLVENMMISPEENIKIHLSKVDYNIEVLYNLLVAKDFPWLDLDFQEYQNEDHISVSKPSIRKGLRFIYGI